MARKTLRKMAIQAREDLAYTKQANYLSRAADGMIKRELHEEFSKLSSLATSVSAANEDYSTGLLADAEVGAEKDE